MKIKIKPNGDMVFLYRDDLPVLEEGNLHVTRASNVEWDLEKQAWYIILPHGDVLASGFKRRADAIAYEIKALEQSL